MKKFFILAAAALVTLASCVKNNADTTAYEQGRQINFSAVTGLATKAAITDNYFPTDAGNFGVYAYYVADGDNWADDFASSALYMGTADGEGDEGDATTGVSVEYDSTPKIWKPSQIYYWPLQGSLTFFAYYPATLTSPAFDLSAKQFSIGSFTVNTTVSEQKEVLVSSFAEDQTSASTQQYVFGAGEGQNSGSNHGVQIQFKHTLSQIVFTAAADATVFGRGLSFKINDITVGARGTSAGMTVVPGSTPSWTAPTTLATFDILSADFPNAEVTGGVAANWLGSSQSSQIGSALLMIPNADFEGASGTADDDYFTVTYTLYRTSDGLNMGSKTVKLWFKDNKTSPVTNWQPGKKYTYRLTIGLEEIYFAPEVGNWENATAQDVTVPGNGTTV